MHEVLPATPLTPDERRLVALLATIPSDDLDGFRRACASVDDWGPVLATATEHGLLRVLQHYFEAAGVELPGGVLEDLRRQAFLQWAPQTRLAALLREAIGALSAAGVVALPLKGPVLAERLFGDPLLRPSSDLDLLVRPADLDRASDALVGLGYRPGDPAATSVYHRKHHHHLLFVCDATAVPLELHFHASSRFGVTISAEDLIRRASPFETAAGDSVLVLAPEDEFLYLATHAAGHFRVHLKWLFDLKVFLAKYPEVDLREVFERARKLGLSASVAFALHEIGMFGVDRLYVDRLGPLRLRLVAALRRGSRDAAGRQASTLASLCFAALLSDRWTTSARVVRKGLGRIARRRARRLFPGLVPDTWGG